MKTNKTYILCLLFTFFGLNIHAQNINWLDVKSFEESIKEADKNFFIYIENDRDVASTREKAASNKMNSKTTFLEDEEVIKYLSNFNCFKFDPKSESINFLNNSYSSEYDSKRKQHSHEFSAYLSSSDDKLKLPAIVIKDKDFKLISYKDNNLDSSEVKVVIAAQNMMKEYLNNKLSADSPLLQQELKQLDAKIKRNEKSLKADKTLSSIFSARQNKNSAIKMMTYFNEGHYQKIDFKSYKN